MSNTAITSHPAQESGATTYRSDGPVATTLPRQESDKVRLSDAATICPSCSDTNTAEAMFCGGCGKRLWEPCVECSTPNAVGKGFCGNCGTNLVTSLHATEKALRASIASAETHLAAGQIAAALTALEGAKDTTNGHTQLAPLTKQAQQLQERLEYRREEAIGMIDSVVESAQQALDYSDHRTALAEIKKIPESLRNSTLHELFKQASERNEDILRLRNEVKQRLAVGNYEGLLPIAQRLLNLEPEDPKVAQLVNKLTHRKNKTEGDLASKLIAAAEKALASNDYPAAAKALEAIPSKVLPSLQQRLDAAKESIWLARQLATAPYATFPAVRLAERFLKRQPTDKRLANAVKQLQERYKESQSQPKKQHLAWAKPPAEGVLESTVDFAQAPAELIASARDAKALPSQLMLCYGLALQAIDSATPAVDLTPKSGSRWSLSLGLGRKKPTTGWGIDIGSHSIKAIRLANAPEGQTAPTIEQVITLAAEESYPTSVATLMEQIDVKGLPVVLNLPSTQTLGRFFELPAPEGKRSKFDEAIRFEAKTRIPIDADKAVIDTYDFTIEDPDDTTGVERRQVTLLAAKRIDAELRRSPFESSDASSVVIGSGALALINALKTWPQEASEATTALVDIGYTSTTLVVSHPLGLWFRALYGGTSDLDQAIAKNLKTDRATASMWRQKIHKAPAPHLVDEALAGARSDLSQKLSGALGQFRNEFGRSISRLVVCGGGSESFGMVRHLRTGQ